jgi:hypothetical protein
MDNDFFRFDKLTPSIQEEIFTSKEWTWAVFLREPAERLLSAYLDKIAKLSTQEKIFDAFGMNATADGFTFENFVQRLDMEFNKTGCKINKDDKAGVLNGMTGLGWCSDPREYGYTAPFFLVLHSIAYITCYSIGQTGGHKSCLVGSSPI